MGEGGFLGLSFHVAVLPTPLQFQGVDLGGGVREGGLSEYCMMETGWELQRINPAPD